MKQAGAGKAHWGLGVCCRCKSCPQRAPDQGPVAAHSPSAQRDQGCEVEGRVLPPDQKGRGHSWHGWSRARSWGGHCILLSFQHSCCCCCPPPEVRISREEAAGMPAAPIQGQGQQLRTHHPTCSSAQTHPTRLLFPQ